MEQRTEDGGGSGAPSPGDVEQQRNDVIVAGVFSAIGMAIAITSYVAPDPFRPTDPIGPHGFPLLVGVIITVSGLSIMARQLLRIRRGQTRAADAVLGQASDEPDVPVSPARSVAVIAALTAYVFTWEWLGFIISSLAFVIIALKLMSVRSWKLVIGAAVIYTTVAFVMFGLFLDVSLPLGPLEALFVDLGIVEQVR